MPPSRHLCLFACSLALIWSGRAQAQEASPATRAAREYPRPGDHLVVHVLGDSSQPANVIVDERGNVPLPMLGVVNIGRLTIGEIPDTIRARYSKYLRNAAIDVHLDRRITVDGEVVKPGVYYIELATTLRDVVAQAGGLGPSANPRGVFVVRNGTRTAVADWQTNDSSAVALQSGDEVVVGRRNWLELNALGALSAAALLASVVFSIKRF